MKKAKSNLKELKTEELSKVNGGNPLVYFFMKTAIKLAPEAQKYGYNYYSATDRL